MSILTGIEPERVWYYFGEISKIPRCSGNEGNVRNYIINFAQTRKLDYRVDKAGNVCVTKRPFPGYEERPGIALQAHMDMVCEKNSDVNHDFKKDPIKLRIVGEDVRADGTTLGADNGIGMAAMLALLEDQKLEHGKVECLFTVEEETGLKGAMELGKDMITTEYMINLDSEEAGTIYIGCAGGIESKITINSEFEALENSDNWNCYSISITGLKGGHSGGDIGEERANALKLMGRLLYNLRKTGSIRLISLKGGDKHNAIPRESFAVIAFSESDGVINQTIEDFKETVNKEFKDSEDEIKVSIDEVERSEKVLSYTVTEKIINMMVATPHGVVRRSSLFDNMVERSTNFAAINVDFNQIVFHMSHRSAIESGLEDIMNVHSALADLVEGGITFSNRYPAWYPDTSSKLLKLSTMAFRDVYGKDPNVKVIHAGLEAAIIKDKYKNMDIISIGPTIENPHSPMESVNIKTVKLFWDSLLKILQILE